MKTIDLEQNTPDWLEFRRNKIGASDAPIILGKSPFKTAHKLYTEKHEANPQIQSEAMKRGHDLEPIARAAFNESAPLFYNIPDIYVTPLVVQSDAYEWMIASLDGIDIINRILVEIKCPGEKDHRCALNGTIPGHYYAQLQHQMYVTDYDEMCYFSYRDGSYIILTCKRDDEFIKQMIVEEKKFMACLETSTPPQLSDRDYEDRDDIEFIDTAYRYAEVEKNLVQLQDEKERLRELLVTLSNQKNCRGAGVKIAHNFRKGAIDYAKIPDLKVIDLERYRKASTSYCTISLV